MRSLFVGVYSAVYEYTPRSEQELSLREGDILCVIQKPDDDEWWKAKKKGNSVDDEEPVGLVPSNYIEEAKPIGKYKALFDYTAQAEEELSFKEDAQLDVYDVSDPEWVLAGIGGQFGFAPANYIEVVSSNASETVATVSPQQPTPAPEMAHSSPETTAQGIRNDSPSPPPQIKAPSSTRSVPPRPIITTRSPPSSVSSPTNAGFSHGQGPIGSGHGSRRTHKPTAKSPVADFSDSDSDGPGLPIRRPGQPPYHHDAPPESPRIPPGFRAYPVQEVDNKKKRAATLGLGAGAIILLPDKSSRPKEEWTVDNMVSYNYEGKHVFLEFKNPSRSLDLHAGSTDRMEEIISALGEMRGLHRASGLDEIVRASKGSNKEEYGTVLYDFPAQGEDEVSVTVGDSVTILDASNEEWWHVRRHVNGAEGVVPSSYIERSLSGRQGIIESPGVNRTKTQKYSKPSVDITPAGVPDRRSSLPSRGRKPTITKSKPEPAQVRTWTDRSNSFKVDAQFLSIRDGKIHLHKTNGVKIAVPVSKMSMQDLKYVEDREGISLDEDKPLSELMKQRGQRSKAGIQSDRSANRGSLAGASVESSSKTDHWYKFFLGCGIDEKSSRSYAAEFQHNNIDESILDDVTASIMRTLGMKEGDILRVTKKIDQKNGISKRSPDPDKAGGGLFSGPGGVLKNGTSRGRPAPGIQTSTSVDPKAFESKASESSKPPTPVSKSPRPTSPGNQATSGFDDDAWEPKTSKKMTPPPAEEKQAPPQQAISKPEPIQSPAVSTAAAVPAALTGAMKDIASLSLSTTPLQPTIQSTPNIAAPTNGSSLTQQPGLGLQFPAPYSQAGSNISTYGPNTAAVAGRARPLPSATSTATGTLGIPPPPTRPLSAPQTFTQMPQQQQPLMPMYTSQPAMNPNYSSAQSIAPHQQPSITGLGMPMNQPQYQNPSQFVTPQLGTNFQASYMQQPVIQQFPVTTGMQFCAPQTPQFTGMQTGGPIPSYGANSQLPPALIPTARPLSVQPTGPPPTVKFGVQPKKLMPQPTGRADLSKATPDNPFGF